MSSTFPPPPTDSAAVPEAASAPATTPAPDTPSTVDDAVAGGVTPVALDEAPEPVVTPAAPDEAPVPAAMVAPDAALPMDAPAPVELPVATPAARAAPVPDCTAQLKQLFPALFSGTPKPVKLRIQDDIQARAPAQFTKRALTVFFRRHTTSTSYLIALSRAEQRLDLDGQPAGPVSDEHRQAALEELARRRARRDAQRGGMNPAAGADGGVLPAGADGTLPAGPGAPGGDRPARPAGPPRQRPPRQRDPRAAAGNAPRPTTDAPVQGDRPPRPDRPQGDRPPRPDRPQGDRPPRADRPQGDRPPRSDRPQGDRPPRQDRPPRPNPPHAAQRDHRAEPATPPRPTVHLDPQQQERARLLRDYEANRLSEANFCVLKGLTPARLAELLAQARQEAGPSAVRSSGGHRPPHQR